MPSAFRARGVERFGGCGDAGAVSRRPPGPPSLRAAGGLLAASLAAACAGVPTAPARATVAVPAAPVAVVAALPPGTWLLPQLAADVPDDPRWRAAAVWWREALRQSVAFAVHDAAQPTPERMVVRLAIATEAQALTAFGDLPGRGEVPLGGDRFVDGDLAAAIDRLACTVRAALGEAVQPPVPVAACTSPEPRVVTAVEDGRALLRDGGASAALRAFRQARQGDGGSPFVLDGLAAATLLLGDTAGAERIAREALGYEARLSPTTQHRLARTLLLARASAQPVGAQDRDRELALLARTAAAERPHDPEPRISAALAANFLGDFAAARPLLEDLAMQLPDQAVLAYHLGWARLASGEPAAAVTAFQLAAVRLPGPWVAVPLAIALDDAGRHDDLDRHLAALLRDAETAEQRHAVLRMQAAHAWLHDDRQRAAEAILADCREVLTDPLFQERHAGEFAESGALLVRLGRAADLEPMLATIQGQRPASAIADVCAFLGGMCDVARTGAPAAGVVARLGREGGSAWSELLVAYGHEVRGEVADMQAALARAARLDDSPMTKALLANGLAAIGRTSEAETLRATLRRELTAVHLRRPATHPLLAPELAFAYLGR